MKKSKQRNFFLNLWRGKNRDRSLLFGIIFMVWLVITFLEEYLPERVLDFLPCNVALFLLSIFVLFMFMHSLYLYFAQRRSLKLCIDKHTNEYNPSLDIFISAHNEEEVIGLTIDSMMKLNYPNYKIYIINDRSYDRTKQILDEKFEQYGKEKLHIIHRSSEAFPGKAAALNDALNSSEGDIVCVFDADARVNHDFFEIMVPMLNNPVVAAVQAQKVISNPERNFLVLSQYHEYAMDTYLQVGRDAIRGAVELRGNGQIIKREALHHVGGWNEDTLTDDLDLSTSLHVNGWDIKFSSQAKVFEEGVPTMDGFIKQRRRWAEGSMRRYLNYFLQLLRPGVLNVRQMLDTIFQIGQFSIPFWLFLDVIYEIVRFSSGRETYLTSFMIITALLGTAMSFNQYFGLRLYRSYSPLKATWYSFLTNIYIFLAWLVVIIITYRKILFSRTVGRWTRTQHGK